MKHVSTFIDRNGHRRWRFRKTGLKDHYFKSAPGEPGFDEEYADCYRDPADRKPPSEPLPHLSLVRQLRGDYVGGHVYFVEAENGLIKVGFSKSIRERFKKLATATPLTLTLLGLRPGTAQAEREIHKRFADQRVMGEWFKPSSELRELATGTIVEQRLT